MLYFSIFGCYILVYPQPVEVTEVPKGTIDCVLADKKSEDELDIVFWDFAGQDLYYTTHQVSKF